MTASSIRSQTRVGIVGTGFIGRGLGRALMRHGLFKPSFMLTRRSPADLKPQSGGIPFTNSTAELIDHSDVIVECSGDPVHATNVIAAALDAGLPVITMNAEFQVTTGSSLIGRGLLTEAHGDQPGALAELHEKALGMGFQPMVYGNRKGFLDPDPTPEAMRMWASRQGISLEQVTAATDGTKIQIEQVLVANGLGVSICDGGFIGEPCDHLEDGARKLFETAVRTGKPLSDYVICPKVSDAVFLVATHRQEEAAALKYFRLGDGPAYLLRQPCHLCHLEIPLTIQRIRSGGGVLINNGPSPAFGVAGIAKHDLRPGERINRAIGSFDIRGQAIRLAAHPDHVPIGLIAGATLDKPVAKGQMITKEMVDLPESMARSLWEQSIP